MTGLPSIRSTTRRFLVLLCCAVLVASSSGQKSDGIIRDNLERKKKDPVMQLSIRRKPLKSKELRGLIKKIRSIKTEDIQVVIGDNVDSDYSPQEMATKLVNNWQTGGSMTERGILILLAMERNRIEIEFGHGLAHILNADWCHEVALTKMVPWFREGDYFKGLQEAVLQIEKSLQVRHDGSKWKRRGKWLAAIAGSYGAWKFHRRRLRRGLKRLLPTNYNHGDDPPPPRIRRRRMHKGRSNAPKVSTRGGGFLSWLDLADLFSLLQRGANNRGSAHSKYPAVGHVNVFVSPDRQAPSQAEVQDSVTPIKHIVQNGSPLAKMAENIPEHPRDFQKSASLVRSTAFLQPEPFHSMNGLTKLQSETRIVVPKSLPPPSKSSSRLGGGASWSTAAERVARNPEAVIPAAKDASANPHTPHGGGASWLGDSGRIEQLTRPAKITRASGDEKRNGGGASWSSADSRRLSDDESKGGGATW
jgi:uncharacterized membrane protein YgcG